MYGDGCSGPWDLELRVRESRLATLAYLGPSGPGVLFVGNLYMRSPSHRRHTDVDYDSSEAAALVVVNLDLLLLFFTTI